MPPTTDTRRDTLDQGQILGRGPAIEGNMTGEVEVGPMIGVREGTNEMVKTGNCHSH